MKWKALLTIVAAFVAAMALATPASANSRGQCNTEASRYASNVDIFISNLRIEGVLNQFASYARKNLGYRPARDGSVSRWVRQQGFTMPVPRGGVTLDNYYCRGREMHFWNRKHRSAGDCVIVTLPAKYKKAKVRLQKPANPGWMKKRIKVTVIGQCDCSNPSKAKVWKNVWVRIPDAPVFIIKNAVDWRQVPLEPTDSRLPDAFNFITGINGVERDFVYNSPIGTKMSVGAKCRVGTWVTVDERPLDGWITPGPQRKKCTRDGVVFTFVNELCPPEVWVSLVKYAKKAGKKVPLAAGVFEFEVLVNGESKGLFTNKAGGRVNNLLKVLPDQQVQLCEKPEPRGAKYFRYRPTSWCSPTKTAADRSMVFTFTNNCAKKYIIKSGPKAGQCRRT